MVSVRLLPYSSRAVMMNSVGMLEIALTHPDPLAVVSAAAIGPATTLTIPEYTVTPRLTINRSYCPDVVAM